MPPDWEPAPDEDPVSAPGIPPWMRLLIAFVSVEALLCLYLFVHWQRP